MLHTSVTLPAPLCAPRGTRLEMVGEASEVQAEKMFNFLHADGGLLGGGQLQFLLSAAWGQGGAVLHADGGLLGGGQLQFLLSAAWGQDGAGELV